MKKYKLGEIATIINGVSYNPKEIIDDGIRILRGGNIQENDLKLEDNDVFLPFSYKNASNQIQWGDTIIVASTGSSITLGKVATCFETLPNTQIGAFLRIIRPKDKKWAMLISMWLHSSTFKDYILKQAKGTSINNIRKDYLEEFTLLWSENEVNGISRLYLNIANKIALNRAINHNLEAIANQLYDYWFVQFDFPNEEGKPYKSSGGKMVWNEKLKREIPEGWKDITLNAFIDKNKSGDWGYDTLRDGTIKVGCVRGADIIKLNDVPTRHITSQHSDRLLEDGDIVVEISGGSPVQATGRVALITDGVIGRNGGALVCSNFCQSFSMKRRVFSEYFYYLWKNLYDNDNMFNFEGKTSGIKNFQIDVFLANHWFEPLKELIEAFHAVVSKYHLMIDQNIIENNNLTKRREELLPLLMNGRV